jgi:ankyrin repeat protein
VKAQSVDEKKISQDPIMEAIFEENSEELKKLVTSAHDRIQKKDALGFSYLHLAAGVGNPELIEILIAAGLSVNTKLGKKQSTPAHSAVSWSKVASLKVLLKHGADLNLTNADGKTPADLAMELRNPEVLEFFKSQNSIRAIPASSERSN